MSLYYFDIQTNYKVTSFLYTKIIVLCVLKRFLDNLILYYCCAGEIGRPAACHSRVWFCHIRKSSASPTINSGYGSRMFYCILAAPIISSSRSEPCGSATYVQQLHPHRIGLQDVLMYTCNSSDQQQQVRAVCGSATYVQQL